MSKAHGSWDDSQRRVLERAAAGESLLVRGGPGTGKTTVARHLFTRALESGPGAGWAPALMLTPDRRRSVEAEAALASDMPQGVIGLSGSGSHRLIRSLDSYAYLVLGLWQVERREPLPRPTLTSGAKEDAWLAEYLAGLEGPLAETFPPAVRGSEGFRTEIRNLVARAGQFGLLPGDFAALARELKMPMWEVAAEAYAEYSGGGSAFAVTTPHLDSARIPRIAAQILRRWNEDKDAQGVLAEAPVPHLLVLDDSQDMPESAAPLIAALAELGTQIVATASPEEAVAAYRGGVPGLGLDLAESLGWPSERLSSDHRSAGSVAALTRQVEAWLAPRIPAQKPEGGSELSAGKVRAELFSTRSQHDRRAASILSESHLYDGVEWDRMAVVVRHSGSVLPVQQALSRSGVPVHSGERPIVLSRVPICGAMLRLLLPGESDDPDEDARQLLTSPLVGADALTAVRMLRRFRRSDPTRSLAGLADLLGAHSQESPEIKWPPDQRSQVRVARKLWQLRKQATALPAQEGLWVLWKAAGLGAALREQALGTGWRALIAGEDLDAVLALFRKADLWQQERAESEESVEAGAFALELLEQSIATDPLVPKGLRQPGVSVVTPTQAAGREWDVVVLAGVEEGTWPAGGGGSVGRVEDLELLLRSARKAGWAGECAISQFLPSGGHEAPVGNPSAYHRRRRDEVRMFLVAVSRSTERLHLLAVDNEDVAPSTFLTPLVSAGVLEKVEGKDSQWRLRDLRDAALRMRGVLMSEGTSPEEKADAALVLALLKAKGVEEADPAVWSLTGSVSTDSPILEAGPLRLSPSNVDLAAKCPLRWFLQASHGSAQDLAEDSSDLSGARLGSLVHAIAERFPDGDDETLLAALEEEWGRWGLGRDTVWERGAYAKTQEQLRRLGRYLGKVGPQLREVRTETQLRFEVEGAVVSGRADRVEVYPDGSARVVDIKTGSVSNLPAAETNAQLWTYQLGVQGLGFKSAGAALLPLASEKGEMGQGPLSPEEALQKKEDLESLVSRLSGARLEAVPARDVCGTCPFETVCPAQDASARSHE